MLNELAFPQRNSVCTCAVRECFLYLICTRGDLSSRACRLIDAQCNNLFNTLVL